MNTQEIRLACYSLSRDVLSKVPSLKMTDVELAGRFAEFCDGSDVRLNVVRLVVQGMSSRASLASLLGEAAEASEFVTSTTPNGPTT